MRKYLLRVPTLVLLVAVLVNSISGHELIWAGYVVLLFVATAQVAAVVLRRLILGYLDSYFRLTTELDSYSGKSFGREDLYRSRPQQVWDFVVIFFWMLVVVELAFAGSYAVLQRVCQPEGAFALLVQGAPPFLQFLYFSLVTTATVGFGDIEPTNLMAQLTVGLHIALGMAIVLVLFAAFSATLESEEASQDESPSATDLSPPMK